MYQRQALRAACIIAAGWLAFLRPAHAASGCIVLDGFQARELCGEVILRASNQWTKNEVVVDDSISVDLRSVRKMTIGDSAWLRAREGPFLSDFARKTVGGKAAIYEKSHSVQFGVHTMLGGTMRYFSLDDDSLRFFNFQNLRRDLADNESSRSILQSAGRKRVLSTSLRLLGAVPLVIGVSKLALSEDLPGYAWFGVGLSMMVAPSFTLAPSIRKDMRQAIDAYNGGRQ